MKTNLSFLRACTTACLAIAAASALGGCELYFGNDHDHDGGDKWSYCADDGYYVCDGDECQWSGASCPSEPGYDCTADKDCAAGCYCGPNGTCEEAGFCNDDSQCPSGYTCDEDRSSCVPSNCTADSDCNAGEYCDEDSGKCIASCECASDAEAQQQGWANCDELRATCDPEPTAGSCEGVSTCNIQEPTCAAGQVALVSDGCYTGTCGDIASCDLTPECEKLQAEGDCSTRSECTSVYYGTNCTSNDPSHTACTVSWSRCSRRTSARAERVRRVEPKGSARFSFARAVRR
jgi:hypothetical protein